MRWNRRKFTKNLGVDPGLLALALYLIELRKNGEHAMIANSEHEQEQERVRNHVRVGSTPVKW